MNTSNKFLSFLALMLFTGVASAATTINPNGSDYWTLYVFGNAEVTYDILTAIKGLLSGDIFGKVLSVFGLIGVLIVATAAGFDPGKNAPKFFTLIVTVWVVVYLSLGSVATVKIIDRVGLNINRVDESERGLRGNEGKDGIFTNIDEGSAGFLKSYIVTDVPAIVAIPISMISTLGHWMTEAVEQHFPTPHELKVSSGYYNLSAQLIQDANKLRITDKSIEKSVSNYINDCVVPSMALQKLSVTEIIQSSNIWKTLEKANNSALLTANLVHKKKVEGPKAATGNVMADNMAEHKDVYGIVGGAAIITCERSYERITEALVAIGYVKDDAENSGRTGTEFLGMSAASPLSNYYTSSMNWLSSGGTTGAQFVQQKAMIASLTGSFREAAVKTGNNELITATSIALAEQSQKSAWVAAADIFNNTMGYVYSALQAFMMAITPLVVLALMLPTFGVAIVKNFLQIFLWLAMWEPMLAVINFLIQSFSRASMGPVLEKEGLTMVNSATVSEMANMSSVAAGFLGTMVPLLTWGLVKGGIAFTEFISHGIGSSFANAAGAQAAGGNVSMGAVSMNMMSANKMNMATQDAFGYMSTMGNTSAGSVSQHMDGGGSGNGANLTNFNPTSSLSHQIGRGAAAGETTQSGVVGDMGQSAGQGLRAGTSAGSGTSGSDVKDFGNGQGVVISTVKGIGADANTGSVDQRSEDRSIDNSKRNDFTSEASGSVKPISFNPNGSDQGSVQPVMLPLLAAGAGAIVGAASMGGGVKLGDTDSTTESSSTRDSEVLTTGGGVQGRVGTDIQTTASSPWGDTQRFSTDYDNKSTTSIDRSADTNASVKVSGGIAGSTSNSLTDSTSAGSGFSYSFGMTWHDAQEARWGVSDMSQNLHELKAAETALQESQALGNLTASAAREAQLRDAAEKQRGSVLGENASRSSLIMENAAGSILTGINREAAAKTFDPLSPLAKNQENMQGDRVEMGNQQRSAREIVQGLFTDAKTGEYLVPERMSDQTIKDFLRGEGLFNGGSGMFKEGTTPRDRLMQEAPDVYRSIVEQADKRGIEHNSPVPESRLKAQEPSELKSELEQRLEQLSKGKSPI